MQQTVQYPIKRTLLLTKYILKEERKDVSAQWSPELCVNLLVGSAPSYSKHENSSGINSNHTPADRGLNIHSLHSVCVQGCRLMFDTVGWFQFGWAGVLTFTFAPRDLYWGDRKHTSVKLSRVILYQSYLVDCVYRSQWRGKHGDTALEKSVYKKIP